MKVVLDSSVFIRDYQMHSPTFQTFLSQHANAGHQFIFLEIVRDELLNKYKEFLREQKSKIDDGIKDIRLKTGKNLAVPMTDEDLERMTNEYVSYLSKKLKQSDAIILDYPSTPHKKIVERALQRKKPFDSKGHNGYRDVLIWESILELLAREPAAIAFISQNPRDFAEKNEVLHSELKEEIDAFQHDDISVTYYPSLDDFVSKEITPMLKMVDDPVALLAGDELKGFDLSTFTSSQLDKFIDVEEVDPTDIGLPSVFEMLQISAIENVGEIRTVDMYSLTKDDVLIQYECLVSVSFTFLIENSEYWGLPDELMEKIEVWDSDWNDYYRMCYIGLDNVLIRVRLVLNKENVIVQSAELDSISVEE